MLDALPHPLWLRDHDGRLTWVNAAYARAVEAPNGLEAVVRGIELLDRAVRDESQKTRARDGEYRGRVPVVVAGERRMFDIMDLVDAARLCRHRQRRFRFREPARRAEGIEREPRRNARPAPHRRRHFRRPQAPQVLQRRLPPAVGARPCIPRGLADGRRDSRPPARICARLPEQADYRAWKIQVLEAYRSLEPREGSWYLPDGRTLRVVTNPNPHGGITYLFDDVTERFHLETQFNAAHERAVARPSPPSRKASRCSAPTAA